jgi:hypothetical protein
MPSSALKYGYDEYLNKPEKSDYKIIPMQPAFKHDRYIAQTSTFTFHFDLTPLEKLYEEKKIWLKFVLPCKLFNAAKYYLFLNDINEYKLFPDLDGLGREIEDIYFG